MIEKNNQPEFEVPISKTNYVFYPLSILGRGQFGTVYKGKNIKTNEIVAVKHLIITDIDDTESKLKRETSLMRDKELQNSPNIVKCYDVFIIENQCYIITELCDCSLREYVKEMDISEDEALSLIYNIIQGYLILRKRNIIHRDLKPENILIKNKISKIADFGSARIKSISHTEDVGTLPFKAPEILAGNNNYDDLVDMWSLGVTLYYMIYKDYPFKSHSFSQFSMLQEIKKSNGDIFKKDIKIKPETQNLIMKMLEIEKENRIKWSQIESHPAFDFLKIKQKEKEKKKVQQISMNKVANPAMLEVSVPGSNYVFYPIMVIGRSEHSTVYKGFDKKKNKDVAIKNILLYDEISINIKKELTLIKETELQNCENILRCYDIFFKDKNYYLISELCEYSLYDFIRKYPLNEVEALRFTYQIMQGYKILRKKNVKHSWLRPESILVKHKIAKISDFGTIKIKNKDDIAYILYKAPETLENPNLMDEISDMWSFGITLYYMIYRDLPYKTTQCISAVNLIAEIKKIGIDIFAKKEIKVSIDVQNLLSKMLEVNRDCRMKWDALALHPAIERGKTVAMKYNKKLLTENGKYEKSLNEILEVNEINDQYKIEKSQSPHTSAIFKKKNPEKFQIITSEDSSIQSSDGNPRHQSLIILPNKNSSSSTRNSNNKPRSSVINLFGFQSSSSMNYGSNGSNDDSIITIDMTKKDSNNIQKSSKIYIPNYNGDNFTTGYTPILVDDSLKRQRSTATPVITPSGQPAYHRNSDIISNRVIILGYQDAKNLNTSGNKRE